MKPSWVDRVNESNRPEPPPKSGKGSSRSAWIEYATSLGHKIPDGATRASVIELVEAGPPPAPRSRGVPRVAGDVYHATRAAVEAASHLTEMDQAAIEVLLDLARTIDGFTERPAGDVDNWTTPTFLRYSESLGLTPVSRLRLGKPEVTGGKLAELRSIRGGRAVG